MTGLSRRGFLTAAGTAAAGTAATAMGLPAGMAEALAEPRRRGRLDDVEHVVILMQENRSFDHYYGTLRGVRGFGDRAALRRPGGRNVFQQPDPARTDGGFLLPFHVDTLAVNGQELGDLDHSWDGMHQAWQNGRYTGWVGAKTEMTMSYFTHSDIPFQRALASAFTLCDHYFCSIQGPTTPNRLFLWSGTIDPHGRAGGPAIDNPADYNPVYSWTSYPERLQAAGISWQVYANDEIGDDGEHPFVGDYGDNPLWLFQAYHDALDSADPKQQQLAARANVKKSWKPDSGKGKQVEHVLAPFIDACRTGTLPQVSWVVAPYGYSEHPAARPVDGAAYTAGVLQALWENPALWKSTAVLIDYDENDGFFDHLLPPVPPPGTPDEWVNGRPVGLGPRVPMTVVSPWSRGGWVNSEVFDHTSVLRFLETWTGVREPNISTWRRAICGDLTSCFDFGERNLAIPMLPDTAVLRRQADLLDPQLPSPVVPPAGRQAMPQQEPGTAPARPLPYQPLANVAVTDSITVSMQNAGVAAVQLAVYSGNSSQRFDLTPNGSATYAADSGPYDLWVHGPNGFLRHFADTGTKRNIEATMGLTGSGRQPKLRLRLDNPTDAAVIAEVTDAVLSGNSRRCRLLPRSTSVLVFDPVQESHGWYDVAVAVAAQSGYVRRFAGHLENGRPSVTG